MSAEWFKAERRERGVFLVRHEEDGDCSYELGDDAAVLRLALSLVRAANVRPPLAHSYPWKCPGCGDVHNVPDLDCGGCKTCCPDRGCDECRHYKREAFGVLRDENEMTLQDELKQSGLFEAFDPNKVE